MRPRRRGGATLRAFVVFSLLIAFAGVNLLMNFWVPNGLKLLLVPAFAILVVATLRKAFRRPG